MIPDPHHPLPLYHQIAGILRGRIAAGDLRVGDTLPSMRLAAREFGVNLHTVRHAYLALSREGLVELRGPRGTRVVSTQTETAAAVPALGLDEFLAEVRRRASLHFGLSAARLAEHIAAMPEPDRARRVSVAVVECSAWQCRCHVSELLERWDVDAHPHPLHEDASSPAADIVIGTWFHYNDVRRRWPDLLHRIEFLTIRPDLTPLLHLPATRWWVVERDEATAGAVTGDVLAQLDDPREVLTHVAADAGEAVHTLPGDDPVLLAPRVFADLDEATRAHGRVFELRYVFDPGELDDLARRYRWRPAASCIRS